MVSAETGARLLLLAAVALLASGLFILDSGIRGNFPAILGFENAFILIAALHIVAGGVLLRKVQQSDNFSLD